ncbi:MAG: acyl-CoA dehydratase activase [Spirochaetaceae bacterium]
MSHGLWLGLDVGSTTVKAAVVDPRDRSLKFSTYLRHGARQAETLRGLLEDVHGRFSDRELRCAVCGSGGRGLAEAIGAFYIQEVVANSIAVREFYPQTRVAIELGGQDAKVVFFHYDPESRQLIASDMRMNGSCAGGTGAFIDEVASLLQIPVEEFDRYAARGTRVYDISGRCGVFAKSDIQPLLNQGVSREDIALSTCHAIARQTIGGLAQGLEITRPVIFVGGPLTFNGTLVRVFAERLGLREEEQILPESPQTLVAYGAALSVGTMFADWESTYLGAAAPGVLKQYQAELTARGQNRLERFFESEEERLTFQERHRLGRIEHPELPEGSELGVYIGIDAGSTTSKLVLLDEEEQVIDSFYANNDGEPLQVLKEGLLSVYRRWNERGIALKVLGIGTTGYGEKLFAAAFRADYHTVETVAHAEAAMHYLPGATFILDIGGQDMKAISVSNDIVTGITLNEACSAGCGSFLESFARSLGIPVDEIAPRAFAATNPSRLGSRCTVFMNSSIITEQKNGKGPNDIMAGLCRSIIENVFTKVVRVSNMSALGDKVVLQGGTFKNDAVLRAFEQYTGIEGLRAPYPGEMGAVGIALLTKRHMRGQGTAGESRFPGFEALESFSYEKENNHLCPFCTNNCNRTLIRFSDGTTFVTGNRCERGEVVGELGDLETRNRLKEAERRLRGAPDLFSERERLLFREYPVEPIEPGKDLTLGLPRVLEFWNSGPFWSTFFRALGFQVRFSKPSSRALYESGIALIPSDTICFPAKLAHGHIEELTSAGVDRIFMPIMNRMPPENGSLRSDHLCAVVKGYPMVLDVSNEPTEKHGIPFDKPIFHWLDERTRERQLADFMAATFGTPPRHVQAALSQADRVQRSFSASLREEASQILEGVSGSDFAVVLAGRPYHSDPLVSHSVSRFFTSQGIPVIPLDALPGLDDVDHTGIRAEGTINFHVRMLSGAVKVAQHPKLELVQIVSFGCGHDAVLTDEVIRIMRTASGREPLTLKLDESDADGPIQIRVRSFIETVRSRREKRTSFAPKRLEDPYAIKYERSHRKEKVILAPNVSEAFARIASAAIRKEGYRIEPLPLADERAIALGKKFVHNDMCFPAQINIGETLKVLESGRYRPEQVVCGLAKAQCDCRLAHYASLARKALDEAGYEQVPIITTDEDTKNMHPAFKLGTRFELRMLWGLAIIDALEDLRRRIRPYEVNGGETDKLFEAHIDRIAEALEGSTRRALSAFEEAVEAFGEIEIVREEERPRVFVIGEFLMNFHRGGNHDVERYLEANGMEVVLPHILDVFRRDFMRMKSEQERFHVRYPFLERVFNTVTDSLFDHALKKVDDIASAHPLHEPKARLPEVAAHARPLIDDTFTSGEGWMIAGEILHNAELGIDSFVIIQPFGCLPNHVTGRGLLKRIKRIHPSIQILSLDYDPDTSFANIENRLQMLVINALERRRLRREAETRNAANQ